MEFETESIHIRAAQKSLDRRVIWKSGRDVSALSGKPVRLRFVLNDADLFSWKFEKSSP